jgi:hypothetical protein
LAILPTHEREEVVIVIKILSFDLNNGYDNYTNKRIVEVNGKKIQNLRHLISIIEDSTKDPFVVFKTEKGNLISFNRKSVEENQKKILDVYRIAADRSTDLQLAASTHGFENEKTVRVHTSNENIVR